MARFLRTNLFIMGVQKCGTTSMADMLAAHPDIFVPSVKETYFFCLDENYGKGEDWYAEEFYRTAKARSARYRVDATPFYLASYEATKRISRYANPDSKFIVVLRDPVARAISAYNHQIRAGNEPLGLHDALAAETDRVAESRTAGGRWWRHAYVEVGRYGAHLSRAFQILDSDRFLIVQQTELSDATSLAARLCGFLGLDAPFPVDAAKHSNPSAMPRSRLLLALTNKENPVKSLARAVFPREYRTRVAMAIDRMNSRPSPHPEISDDTRNWLGEQFTKDQELLHDLGHYSHKP